MRDSQSPIKTGLDAAAEVKANGLVRGLPRLRASTSSSTATVAATAKESNLHVQPSGLGTSSSTTATASSTQLEAPTPAVTDAAHCEVKPQQSPYKAHKVSFGHHASPGETTHAVADRANDLPERLSKSASSADTPNVPIASTSTNTINKSGGAGDVGDSGNNLRPSTFAALHVTSSHNVDGLASSGSGGEGSHVLTSHLWANRVSVAGTPPNYPCVHSASLLPVGSDGSLTLPRSAALKGGGGAAGSTNTEDHLPAGRRGDVAANELSTTSININASHHGGLRERCGIAVPVAAAAGPSSLLGGVLTDTTVDTSAPWKSATEVSGKTTAPAEDAKPSKKENEEVTSPAHSNPFPACSPSPSESLTAQKCPTFTDATNPTTMTTSTSKKRKKKKTKSKKAVVAAAAAEEEESDPANNNNITATNTAGGVDNTNFNEAPESSTAGGGTVATGTKPLSLPAAAAPFTGGPSRGDAAARQANAAAALRSHSVGTNNNVNTSNDSIVGYGGYLPQGTLPYDDIGAIGGGNGGCAARMTPPLKSNGYPGSADYMQPAGNLNMGGGYAPPNTMMQNSNSNNMNSGGGSPYGYYGGPPRGGIMLPHTQNQRMIHAPSSTQQPQQQQMPYPPQGVVMHQGGGGGYSNLNNAGGNMRHTFVPHRVAAGYQQPPQPQPPKQQQQLPHHVHRRTMPSQPYNNNNKSGDASGPAGGYYDDRMDSNVAYSSAVQPQPYPQNQEPIQQQQQQQQRIMPYTHPFSSASPAQVHYSPTNAGGLQPGTGHRPNHSNSSGNAGGTGMNYFYNNNSQHHRFQSAEYPNDDYNNSANINMISNNGCSTGARCGYDYSEGGSSRAGATAVNGAAGASMNVVAAPRVFSFTPEVSPRLCRLIEQEVLTYLIPSLPCLRRRRVQLRTLAEYITAALRHAGRQTGHKYGDISFYIFGSVNMRTVLPDGDNDVTVEVDGLLSTEVSRSPPPPPTPEEAAARRAAAALKPPLPPVTTDSSAGDVDGTMQLTTAADGRPRLAAPAVLSIASGEVLGRVRDYLRNAKTPIFVDSLVMAEVRVLKLVMEGCNYDITIGQFGGVNCVRFLHEMDAVIGGQHLLKRTLLLLKAWSSYEAHVLGGQAGYIGSYAVTVMLISMINTVEFLEDVEGDSQHSSTEKSAVPPQQQDDVSSASQTSSSTSVAAITKRGAEVNEDIVSTAALQPVKYALVNHNHNMSLSSSSSIEAVNDNDKEGKMSVFRDTDVLVQAAEKGKGENDTSGGDDEGQERGATTHASSGPADTSIASLRQLSPLTLLARFLKFYAYFDFDHYCVTAFGPLPLQKITSAPLDLSYLEVAAAHSRPLEGDAAANRAATDINFLGLTAEGEATIGHLIRRRQNPLLTVSGVRHLLDEVNQSRRAERQARHDARQAAAAKPDGAALKEEEQEKEEGSSRKCLRTSVQLNRAGCTRDDAGLMCPSCNTAVFPVRDMNVLDPLRWSSNMVRGVCRNHLQRIRRAFLEGIRLLETASQQLDGGHGSYLQSNSHLGAASTTGANTNRTVLAGVGAASPTSQQSALSGGSSCRSWAENNTYAAPPVLGTPVSEEDIAVQVNARGKRGGGEELLLCPGYPAPHSQCTRREVAVLQLLFPRSVESILKNSVSNCPWNRENVEEMRQEGVPQCATCACPSLLCTPDIHRMCEPQLIFHAVPTADNNTIQKSPFPVNFPTAPTSEPTLNSAVKVRAAGSKSSQTMSPSSPSSKAIPQLQQLQLQVNGIGHRLGTLEQAMSELEEAIAGEDTSKVARSGGPLGEAMVPPVRMSSTASQTNNGGSNVSNNSNDDGVVYGGGAPMDVTHSSSQQQLTNKSNNANSGIVGVGGSTPSMMSPHGLYSPGSTTAGSKGVYGPANTATMPMMTAEEDYYAMQGAAVAHASMGGDGALHSQPQLQPQHHTRAHHHQHNSSGCMLNPMMLSSGNKGAGHPSNNNSGGGMNGPLPTPTHNTNVRVGSSSNGPSQPYVRIGNLCPFANSGGYNSTVYTANSHSMSCGGPNTGLMGRTYANNARVTNSPMQMPTNRGGGGNSNNNTNSGTSNNIGSGGAYGGWNSTSSYRSPQQQQQQQIQHAYAHTMQQQQPQPQQRVPYGEGGASQGGSRGPYGGVVHLKVPSKDAEKSGGDTKTLTQNV